MSSRQRMKKVKLTNSNGNNVGNFNKCFNTYNFYNIVIENVNLCARMKGESNREAYERNMLESISKITTQIDEMEGIYKGCRYDKRLGCDVAYIENVFWGDLYLTNHLVVSKQGKSMKNLEIGDYLVFNGSIYTYTSSTPERYMKYGINNVVIKQRRKSSIHALPIEIQYDNVELEEFDYTKLTNRTLKKLVNRIQGITLNKTMFPENFFVMMLLNLHFAENYEKILFMRQNDYNFLKENMRSIIIPLCVVSYMVEKCAFVDPYTTLCTLTQIYSEKLQDISKMISEETGIMQNVLTNFVEHRMPYLDHNDNIDSIYDDIKKYSHELLTELSKTPQEYQIQEAVKE